MLNPRKLDQKGARTPWFKIVLKAYHAAIGVVIEISDDGKGLDNDMLAEAAVKKGLIYSDGAKVMSEERIDLILLRGFSTAQKGDRRRVAA